MPERWRFYIGLWLFRCSTFYLGIALVQYLFDRKVDWLINALPAAGAAAFLTYLQARLRYIRGRRGAK